MKKIKYQAQPDGTVKEVKEPKKKKILCMANGSTIEARGDYASLNTRSVIIVTYSKQITLSPRHLTTIHQYSCFPAE